jgi:hypothetical protein
MTEVIPIAGKDGCKRISERQDHSVDEGAGQGDN